MVGPHLSAALHHAGEWVGEPVLELGMAAKHLHHDEGRWYAAELTG